MRIAAPRNELKTFVKDEVTRLAKEAVDGAGGTIDVVQGARLVRPNEARILDRICGKNGGEPPLSTFLGHVGFR